MNPEEVMEKARQLRAAGVPLAEIEQYIAAKMGQAREPMAKVPAAATDGSRVSPRPDGGGDLQALLAPGQGKVLRDEVVPALGAHAINAAQSIPFMRDIQAGALAATSDMDYEQSKTALDDLTGEIPESMRNAEQFAAGVLPWTKAGKFAAPIAARAGRTAGAFAKEMPILRNVVTGAGKARRAWNAGKPAAKAMPKLEEVVEQAAPKAPKTLEELIGSLDVLPEEQIAPTLESRLGDVVRNQSPVKQQGATKARFDWFAERQAQKAAATAEEPALEDLLSLSLEHMKKGGTMPQLNETASKIRLLRSPK